MTQKGEMELTVPERGSGRRPRLRTPPLFSSNIAPDAPTPSDQTTRPPRGHYRASTPRQKLAGQAGSNVKAARDARDQGCHFLHLPCLRDSGAWVRAGARGRGKRRRRRAVRAAHGGARERVAGGGRSGPALPSSRLRPSWTPERQALGSKRPESWTPGPCRPRPPRAGRRAPCNYLTAPGGANQPRNLRETPVSARGSGGRKGNSKRHFKNADSPVLNLPGPVCGKGRAAGPAGAGRAMPGWGSPARPTLHRPRSEGVAPRVHVRRDGTMARGAAAS